MAEQRRSSGRRQPARRTGRRPAPGRCAKKLPPITPEEQFEFEKAGEVGIVFWCQKCREMIEPKKERNGKFSCPKCNDQKIVFGTQKSIQTYTSRQKDHFNK